MKTKKDNAIKKLSMFSLALIALSFTFSSTAAFRQTFTAKNLQLVAKNLDHIIVDEPQPVGQNKRPTFYANGVELEKFTVHLCGIYTSKTSADGSYHKHYYKVDPKEIYKFLFTADSNILLDHQYNPNNIIPVIHNSSKSAGSFLAANTPDEGEPTITYNAATTRKILMIYDETSNYFNLYNNIEGFHQGGVWQQNQYDNFIKKNNKIKATYSESNECWADADDGVGDTAVRLYLLATNSLQQTTDLPIYITGKTDLPGNPITPASTVHYDLKKSPITNKKEVNASKIDLGQLKSLSAVTHFYSFFSSLINSGDSEGSSSRVREERGLPVCAFQAGAAFHGLFHYDDHSPDGKVCTNDFPKKGTFDCAEPSCSRHVVLSALSSTAIPYHDLFSGYLHMGDTCPHKSAASTAHVVFKPILNSYSTAKRDKKSNDNSFYVSYTGGVGAYFYQRDNDHKTNSTSFTAGNDNTFYFYSFVAGDEPSPGQACHWSAPSIVKGHDTYGNQINLSVVMANGSRSAVVE